MHRKRKIKSNNAIKGRPHVLFLSNFVFKTKVTFSLVRYVCSSTSKNLGVRYVYAYSISPFCFYFFQASTKEITPGMLLKLRRGHDTKYSGMFKKAAIYFGVHYRVEDAIIPQIYLEFTDYMIGVSYDYSSSDLANAAGGAGGVEISIRYIHQKKALQRAAFR